MVNEHNQLIGFKVYDAQRSLFRSLEVALRPFDLTPGQWNLLNQLDRSGDLSQTALAKLTRKEQATITRYLDTLARKDLITRAPDARDRRAHVISLTDNARKLLKKTESTVRGVSDSIIEGIEQEDINTFLRVMENLKSNAETFAEETHQETA